MDGCNEPSPDGTSSHFSAGTPDIRHTVLMALLSSSLSCSESLVDLKNRILVKGTGGRGYLVKKVLLLV